MPKRDTTAAAEPISAEPQSGSRWEDRELVRMRRERGIPLSPDEEALLADETIRRDPEARVAPFDAAYPDRETALAQTRFREAAGIPLSPDETLLLKEDAEISRQEAL